MIKQVIKRNNAIVDFDKTKLLNRINKSCSHYKLDPNVLVDKILNLSMEVISTIDLDKLLIQEAVRMTELDPSDFNKLNWRFVASNVLFYSIKKQADCDNLNYLSFLKQMTALKDNGVPLYDSSVLDNYSENDLVNFGLQHLYLKHLFLQFDYSGINLLAERYLIKHNGKIVEDPLYFFMTLALIVAIPEKVENRLPFASSVLKALLERKVSLATPILLNLRRPSGNLSSCFIGTMPDDLDGIYRSIQNIAKISQNGGGTGINVSNIRATGSKIRGVMNAAKGPLPWIKLVDDTLAACDQVGCISSNSLVIVESKPIRNPNVSDTGKAYEDCKHTQDYIPATEVKVGDKIKSFNRETGKNEFNKVLAIMRPVVKEKEQIKLKTKGNAEVISSDWHPTLVKREGVWEYIRTDKVVIGDLVKTNTPDDEVFSIEVDNQADELFIDFEVENVNNYYAGLTIENFVVMHNSRSGAGTVALDIWHYDILSFLDCQKENGDLAKKMYVIQPQVVAPDLFFEKVEANAIWTLFDPHEVKKKYNINLPELYGQDFVKAYSFLENEVVQNKLNLFKQIPAMDLFKKILKAGIETGKPYIFFKDTVNNVNPNKHLGYIGNANLCVESYSNFSYSEKTSGVINEEGNGIETVKLGEWHTCDLVSLVVANCTLEDIPVYAPMCVRILDNSISLASEPILESKAHHNKYRILGIGALGLADYLVKQKYTYKNGQAEISKLAESIAYHAVQESVNLAIERGAYPAYPGSEWSKGIVFGKDSEWFNNNETYLGKEKWQTLLSNLQDQGIRNGGLLSVAPNCQDPNNKVQTHSGVKSIYEILEEQGLLEEAKKLEQDNTPKWINLTTPVSVPTYQGDDTCDRIWYNGLQETIDITFEDGNTYSYTPNHCLLVAKPFSNDWIRCDELQLSDNVITVKNSNNPIVSISKGSMKNTYDFEIKNKHHYLMENGVVSHNTSTSLLMGVTASILPPYNKFFIDKASSGSIPIVPPFMSQETFWYYIENKNTDQNFIVETTKNMQAWIDQGISMELVINLNNPDFSPASLYALYMNAWKSKCKTVYYLRTEAKKMQDDCISCAN